MAINRSTQPIRFGVIGAGRIGKIHAENLATRIPGAQVTMIADPILAAAQETASRLHIPRATADYHEIMAAKDVDALAICSSTNTHAQMIVEAAQRGSISFVRNRLPTI